MSDNLQRIQALALQEKELSEKKSALLNQRKTEIGSLAEYCDALLVPNEILAGIFSQLKQAMDNNSEKLKEWAELGERFLRPKKRNKKAI